MTVKWFEGSYILIKFEGSNGLHLSRTVDIETYYEEYVPPPPKPVVCTGWITVGKEKRVFDTKEEAEAYVKTWSNNQSTHLKCITEIKWEEPAVQPDDSEI